MTRLQKCELAMQKGISYNEKTGEIIGVSGKVIKRLANGYINIAFYHNGFIYQLYGHHFAYYYKYKKIVDNIDHINNIRSDNKISNLRSVTKQGNSFNMKNVKGCYLGKCGLRWYAYINVDYKRIYLGAFNNELEAHSAYLEAKKIYHVI